MDYFFYDKQDSKKHFTWNGKVFRNSENFIISIKLEIFWRSSVFWANRDWNVISLMLLLAIKIVKTPDSDPSQSFYIEHTTKTIRKHHHKTPVYLKTF